MGEDLKFVQALARLEGYVHQLPPALRDVAKFVLQDPQFRAAPASADKHHAYRGGLLVHTAEVATCALDMAAGKEVIRPVLITAAIWHDWGKTQEYRSVEDNSERGWNWEKTEYYNLIHHVAGSYGKFMEVTSGIEEELRQLIGHCILSHHGRREWGSPVEPLTQEAWILHAADYWSSQWGAGK